MALAECIQEPGDTSVSKAKKAISEYRKAIGQPEDLAELMVFYCERASGFSDDVGLQDEGYFDALVRMFEQALKAVHSLPEEHRPEPTRQSTAISHKIATLRIDVAGLLRCGSQ